MTAAVLESARTITLPYNALEDKAYAPTERQAEFHAAPETEKLYGGAVGGGKTTCLVCEVMTLMWEYPHNEGIIARRDFDDLRRTTYAEFLRWCPEELIQQHHKSEHWIRLICPLHPEQACGSLVHFVDAKDMGALKNANLGFVAFDQAEEVSYEAYIWSGTRLRLAHIPYRPRLLSANPGPGWVKKIFIDRVRPSIDDTPEKPLDCCAGGTCSEGRHRFVPALPKDNPYLPPTYVEEQLAGMPASYAQMLIEGRWDVVLNAIYPQLDRRLHLRAVPEGLQFRDGAGAIGVDFGRGHLSAAVAVQQDIFGRKWVRRCWAKSGGDMRELARQVWQMCRDYRINRGRTDPLQDVLAQILSGSEDRGAQRYRFSRANVREGSREARIGMVSSLLDLRDGPPVLLTQVAHGKVPFGPWPESETQPGLFIDIEGEGCRALFDEMLGYHYERTPAGSLKAPGPDRTDDDRVAALEYAIEEMERPYNAPAAGGTYRVQVGGW